MPKQFVRGAEKIQRRIKTIRERTVFNLDAAVADAAANLVLRIKKRFLLGEAPNGSPWAPLAESTIQRKKYAPTRPEYRNAGQGAKLLRTRSLYDSINVIRGSHAGLFAITTGAEARIGVNPDDAKATYEGDAGKISKYGRFLQTGFIHISGTQVPARRWLGLNANDVKSVDNILRSRIRKMIRESASV